MKKKRLIPILLLRNGWIVQSKQFKRYQNLGNPVQSVKRLSEWASDELVYLDISKDDTYDMRRDDIAHPNRQSLLEIIEDVSQVSFMPISVGGKIRTLEDIEKRLRVGADKVVINTQAIKEPDFVAKSSKEFGSQCIVVSIDVKVTEQGYRVFSNGGRDDTGLDPVDWSKRVESYGAGEILLNSIDRDGMKKGYDIQMINDVSEAVNIPVIACGGVGEWEHLKEGLEKTKADAVAAANIFHYQDQSVYIAKKYLYDNECKVRPSNLMEVEPWQKQLV